MYYNVTLGARSCGHCYRGKAISITGTLVALGIQNAMRIRHIVIRGLSATTKFFHFISLKALFWKKNYGTKKKRVFYFLYKFRLKHFSFQEELRELNKKVYWSPRKVPVILVRF